MMRKANSRQETWRTRFVGYVPPANGQFQMRGYFQDRPVLDFSYTQLTRMASECHLLIQGSNPNDAYYFSEDLRRLARVCLMMKPCPI